MKSPLVLIIVLVTGTAALAQQGASSIVNSVHNLSATGPGAVRATAEQEVCIFCHTPHNAAPVQPLWNRSTPASAYRPYTSNSLNALPGQPTGSSKLCLSCHDGTIALGNVLSRGQPISMAGGITSLRPGHRGYIGTDLTDDHPISFRYDSTLIGKDPKLRDPKSLPHAVRLDANQELQCTSCHDAHDNSRGKFMVMDNSNSQLCNSCHNMGATTVTNHMQCASCHQQHTAPSGPYLLKAAKVTDTCLICHQGSAMAPQGQNIAADLRKPSVHDTAPPINQENHVPGDSSCIDCHDAHTMKTMVAVAPAIPGVFGTVSGVNSSGAPIKAASYEYEVCFKCHAEQQAIQPRVPRVIVQANTRLEFSTSAVSYHPVEGPGRATSVPSLRPGYTTASMIYCTDCHSSDSGRKSGGAGPSGPHGSSHGPLLASRYETRDYTTESAEAYALCYRCHDRATLLSSRSNFPEHRRHVVDKRAPCSACHDAHGVSSTQGNATNNAHMINFDSTIVRGLTAGSAPVYRSTGDRRGTCTTQCHGETHNNESYPDN